MLLVLIAAVVVAWFLWTRDRHSSLVAGGLVAGAVGVVAAHWSLLYMAAQLPRRFVPVANEPVQSHRVLAATATYAILDAGGQLVRVSLPSGRITARYPVTEGIVGFYRSAAVHGDAVLLSYYDQRKVGVQTFSRDGWALLDATGWIHPLGQHRLNDAQTSVSWNEATKAFAIYATVRGAEQHRVDVIEVDPAGTVRQGKTFQLGADAYREQFCHVGDRLLATSRQAAPCEIRIGGAASAAGVVVSQCVPLAEAPSRGVFCPGNLELPSGSHWLAPEGVRSFNPPANTPPIRRVYLAAADGVMAGVMAVPEWFSDDSVQIVGLGDRYVHLTYLDDKAATALGHLDGELRIESRDRQGKLQAQGYATGGAEVFNGFVFRSGPEIVVLAPQLTQQARFDAETLRRIDAPGAIAAVRDRLGVWGGPSVAFELALVAVLILALVLVPVAVWALWLRRGELGGFLTVQRALLIYLVLALPTLVVSAARLWHLG